MKVSELVKDIVALAEDKFIVSNHINDCINVAMYTCDNGYYSDEWQVSLERLTQKQLDGGEVSDLQTIKTVEVECRLPTCADSLVKALVLLKKKVELALDWDDCVSNDEAEEDLKYDTDLYTQND